MSSTLSLCSHLSFKSLSLGQILKVYIHVEFCCGILVGQG